MSHLYVPTLFEIPSKFKKYFTPFGMGEEAARNLARKINLLQPSGPIVIAGSAGGLDPELKIGQTVLVRKIHLSEKEWRLQIPKALSHLPQKKIVTVPVPASQIGVKRLLRENFEADLVDCEMGFFMDELLEKFHPQVIFVRCVVDHANQDLDFLNGFRIDSQKIKKAKGFLALSKFLLGLPKYYFGFRRTIGKILRNMPELRGQVQ